MLGLSIVLSFKEIGFSSVRAYNSVQLLFNFLGHFASNLFKLLFRKLKIDWSDLGKTIYLSGGRLMLPIIVISAIIGFSLAFTLFTIFNEIHMGRRALPIAQTAVISNLAPLLIGVILSIQSALNLINANIHKFEHTPDEVMCNYIIPIMSGIMITGLLLYIYSLIAFLVGIYATFHYILNVDVYDHLTHLAGSISVYSIDYSLFKVLIYCLIISLVVGYYYYKIAIHKITLRKAVSRIMTRSLLCIIILSAYLNIFYV